MDERLEFDFLPTPRAELGESPVWSARENRVWWVDIAGRQVFQTNVADGETRSWRTPESAGIVALHADGGVVVGMETGLFRLNANSGSFEHAAPLPASGVRFNDAAVDTAGRLWAATMEFEYREPIGILYRIEPDFTMHEVVAGLYIPNGLAVDAERGRLYFSDSHPDIRTVWVADLDLETGRLGERNPFVRFSDLEGRPDGAAIDVDGNYWIAAVGSGRLHVFSPEGAQVASHAVPMENPTKPAFGGPGLSDLYLTSKAGPGGSGRLAVASAKARGQDVAAFG